MRRLPPLLVLVLSLLLIPTGSWAEAQETQGLDRGQLQQILRSDDPTAALASLTPHQQAAALSMVETELEPTDVLVESGSLATSEATALGLKPPRTKGGAREAVSSGCWYHYYFTGWTLWGMNTASSWMQLNWCGSGGRVTGWSISNVGGSATILNYGGNTRGATNVGWEVRGVTTHRFSFYLGSVTKCMQIRGGATGLYSRSISCDAS